MILVRERVAFRDRASRSERNGDHQTQARQGEARGAQIPDEDDEGEVEALRTGR